VANCALRPQKWIKRAGQVAELLQDALFAEDMTCMAIVAAGASEAAEGRTQELTIRSRTGAVLAATLAGPLAGREPSGFTTALR
jgi:hypothetical protein